MIDHAPAARLVAAKLRDKMRGALDDISSWADELIALGPSTPMTDQPEGWSPAAQVTEWLDRQRILGLISPEGAAAVERLIEDLR